MNAKLIAIVGVVVALGTSAKVEAQPLEVCKKPIAEGYQEPDA